MVAFIVVPVGWVMVAMRLVVMVLVEVDTTEEAPVDGSMAFLLVEEVRKLRN